LDVLDDELVTKKTGLDIEEVKQLRELSFGFFSSNLSSL
jgi:hypothetical protein